jgi:Pyridoxamine 5'-phosphate oxidase
MLESSAELRPFQALLDESMASAGPHLRGIISDERRLGARQLTERLAGMRLLVLVTVTADGRPLAGPVDGYFLHGTFWFSSGSDSVRMRHLAARPR